MKKTLLALALPGLLAGAAIVAPTTPGYAQPISEEIIITGRWRRNVPDDYQSASQSVSYADLDLSTEWGWKELRHRVNLTARYLCDKLGESDTIEGTAPSCRQDAARDAMKRVGTIREHVAPRGTAWVRPTPWASPYAADWATRWPDDPY